jgi:acetate kinase
MYLHRLKKYIGSYVLALGGSIDALVFTDDLGVRVPLIRREVCKGLDWAGIMLDRKRNQKNSNSGISRISSDSSRVPAFSVPAEEEYMICIEGLRLMENKT